MKHKKTKTYLIGDPVIRRKVRDYAQIAVLLMLLFAACFFVGYLIGMTVWG